MQLTEDDIKEFRDLWRQEFGEEIPVEVAHERASQLLELYGVLLECGRTLPINDPPHAP